MKIKNISRFSYVKQKQAKLVFEFMTRAFYFRKSKCKINRIFPHARYLARTFALRSLIPKTDRRTTSVIMVKCIM